DRLLPGRGAVRQPCLQPGPRTGIDSQRGRVLRIVGQQLLGAFGEKRLDRSVGGTVGAGRRDAGERYGGTGADEEVTAARRHRQDSSRLAVAAGYTRSLGRMHAAGGRAVQACPALLLCSRPCLPAVKPCSYLSRSTT